MKKILLAACLVFITGTATVNAQVQVNINIGSQPSWGPTGYDYVNYYYIPDIDVYYNVPQKLWIYNSGNRWVTSASLPSRYSKYNLYNMHKVVINDDRPYLRNNVYKTKYANYRGRHDQQVIRDSKDQRYVSARNNNAGRPVSNGQQNSNNRSNNTGTRNHNNNGQQNNGNYGGTAPQNHNNHGNSENGHR